MIIINADDLGRNTVATTNIIDCGRQGLITSASAMVFMKHSRQAADLACNTSMETGLHLNLTQPFDDPNLPSKILEHHSRIMKYLRRGKWARYLYNPALSNAFDYIYKAQYAEYCGLFGHEPAQIDGHHHMHLCMNMLFDRIIPRGIRVRRNFTFKPREKDPYNRMFRGLIDSWVTRYYFCTDYFVSIEPDYDLSRLQGIIHLARIKNIELMVHPEIPATYTFLRSEKYKKLIISVRKGTYRMLS